MLYGDLLSRTNELIVSEQSNKDNVKNFIGYVSFISQHAKNVDINKLDLSKLSCLEIKDGKLFVKTLNKTEINKTIFDLCPPKEIPLIPKESLNAISGFSAQYKKEQLATTQRAISDLRTTITRRNQEIAHLMSDLSQRYSDFDRLNGKDRDHITPQIEQIQSAGFWKFDSVDSYSKRVYMISDEVWLEFNDRDAKINDRICMGRYKLTLMLGGYIDFRVTAHKDNILVDGYSHPHLAGDSLCLGNASGTIEKALEAFDIVSIAKVCQLILCNYNDESPYVRFSDFKKEYERKMALKMRLIDQEQLLKHYQEALAVESELDFIEDIL